MILIEDFTQLPEGSRVAGEGRVARCPLCGQNGIQRSRYGKARFIHVQVARMLSDGLRVEPEDYCALPAKSAA